MYPPRQAYRPLTGPELDGVVQQSLPNRDPVNLYFHYPFCRQICAFCNLYSTVGDAADQHARYTDALLAELDSYVPHIIGRRVDTVYLGGGTPSAVDPELLGRVLQYLQKVGLCDVDSVPEVAMEVAPDTASLRRMTAYRALGINRVNLGIQTADDTELALIGRRDRMVDHLQGLKNAMAASFDNVCVDLIYGLNGQTYASWIRSLARIIEFRPETICCYPLTIRPSTGFERAGYQSVANGEMYRRYDVAHAMLLSSGYTQETHVRWALPSGGYRQKANHWAGQDIVGVGAGARGYLSAGDYRNGYSVRHRVAALRGWFDRVSKCGHGRDSGIVLDEDERRRRSVVLGLGHLDRATYCARHGSDVLTHFPNEIDALVKVGAILITSDALELSALGQRHRDVIVQLFFSDRIRRLVNEFDYNE